MVFKDYVRKFLFVNVNFLFEFDMEIYLRLNVDIYYVGVLLLLYYMYYGKNEGRVWFWVLLCWILKDNLILKEILIWC